MCTVRPLVLFTALLASSAGQAASVIATPPLEYTGTAGGSVECLVSNLGSDPADVTIELVNTSGTVGAGGPMTILAGEIDSQLSGNVNPSGAVAVTSP